GASDKWIPAFAFAGMTNWKKRPQMNEAQIAEAAPIADRVFVLILQHPHEKREPLATAPAIVATLQHARLVTGLSWPNLSRALGHDADPTRWAVLYLGSV